MVVGLAPRRVELGREADGSSRTCQTHPFLDCCSRCTRMFVGRVFRVSASLYTQPKARHNVAVLRCSMTTATATATADTRQPPSAKDIFFPRASGMPKSCGQSVNAHQLWFGVPGTTKYPNPWYHKYVGCIKLGKTAAAARTDERRLQNVQSASIASDCSSNSSSRSTDGLWKEHRNSDMERSTHGLLAAT
jgi:hypothetical protein